MFSQQHTSLAFYRFPHIPSPRPLPKLYKTARSSTNPSKTSPTPQKQVCWSLVPQISQLCILSSRVLSDWVLAFGHKVPAAYWHVERARGMLGWDLSAERAIWRAHDSPCTLISVTTPLARWFLSYHSHIMNDTLFQIADCQSYWTTQRTIQGRKATTRRSSVSCLMGKWQSRYSYHPSPDFPLPWRSLRRSWYGCGLMT